MNKLLLKTIFLVFLFSCSQDENSTLEEFVTGAKIAGVNGIHFGPDGMLYAASVIGSDISVINTETGEIIKRYGIKDGVIGPDDVAFNSKGEFYWTSILTGEVAGFNVQGNKIISGNPGIGVNPITFSDDDRLFVAQCFYDNGIFEYTDGWTEWNGQYEMNSDSIVLDYYFPVEKPNIYMRGDDRVCAYQVIDGKRELVHDLWIY